MLFCFKFNSYFLSLKTAEPENPSFGHREYEVFVITPNQIDDDVLHAFYTYASNANKLHNAVVKPVCSIYLLMICLIY